MIQALTKRIRRWFRTRDELRALVGQVQYHRREIDDDVRAARRLANYLRITYDDAKTVGHNIDVMIGVLALESCDMKAWHELTPEIRLEALSRRHRSS